MGVVRKLSYTANKDATSKLAGEARLGHRVSCMVTIVENKLFRDDVSRDEYRKNSRAKGKRCEDIIKEEGIETVK